MVYLTKISKYELPNIIRLSYEGDNDLLERFHLRKMELSDAVNCEFGLIDDTSRELELKYFKVVFDGKVIGYAVVSGSFLYSFAVAVKYRKKEVLKSWWTALVSVLGKSFTCGLLSNNTRAIEYMKERGMKVVFESTEKKELREVLLAI